MERDIDLIRELLLRIAANPKLDGRHFYVYDESDKPDGYSLADVTYHVDLLFEAGLVEGSPRSEKPMISKFTWQGHEFVDNIRDDEPSPHAFPQCVDADSQLRSNRT
jgi:hypothetical protein